MHISITGNWASNSLVFAISHGPCAAAPSTPSQRSTLSHHAVVPSRFRVQVRWATRRPPPSEPPLSARVIQRRVRRRNFALRPAFPTSTAGRHARDYYAASALPGVHSGQRTCPFPYWLHETRATPDSSHVHHLTYRRVWASSSAPAASPRLRRGPSPWPPTGRNHPGPEFPTGSHRAVRTATQPISARFELVGRDSHDYYGHSVAIGLASRRRSHVRPRRTF